MGTLYVNDQQVGQARIEATVPNFFSMEEGMDVGRDTASPVTDDYPVANNAFTGAIHWVKIDIGQDDASHLLDPELVLNSVMAQQ